MSSPLVLPQRIIAPSASRERSGRRSRLKGGPEVDRSRREDVSTRPAAYKGVARSLISSRVAASVLDEQALGGYEQPDVGADREGGSRAVLGRA